MTRNNRANPYVLKFIESAPRWGSLALRVVEFVLYFHDHLN